jgi:aspartyl-tRNA(Asn)/glutamyl-tRNA(Gln) amidotransferase subunit B
LTPFQLTEKFIGTIKAGLPALPDELYKKYVSLGLSEYYSKQLSEDKETAAYFEETTKFSKNYKAVVNWMVGPLRQIINESNISFTELALRPGKLANLITIVDEGKVNFSVASLKILPVLLQDTLKTAMEVATELNLLQVSGSADIEAWVNEVVNKMPEKVTEYKKGKKGLIGLFVGEVKKVSKGKADPKVATQILEEKLK